MAVIHIDKVKKVPNRPYTINLSGSLGHSNFSANLEGACLNIQSAHPLSEIEEQKLEDKLRKFFPSNGKFKKKDIDRVMDDNGGVISIKV